MKEQVARLEEIVKQHSTEISKISELVTKVNNIYYDDNMEHITLKNQMDSLHEKLDLIIRKVDYTNGTVRLHTKVLYVVGAVAGTLLITNGSPFVSFLTTLIK